MAPATGSPPASRPSSTPGDGPRSRPTFPARPGPPRPPAPLVAPRVDPAGSPPSPFPTDALTVPDRDQRTGVRLALPLPRCGVERSACDDVRLLNELDGFDLDPRLAVRFTGPIDLGSVTPQSVFLIRLVAGPHEVIGVERLVWDPWTSTLHAHPEALLEPETRYGLVVTRAVRDAGGRPIAPARGFPGLLRSPRGAAAARGTLALLARALARRGVRPETVAVASVFTTGSVTAFLEQARDALDRRPPGPLSVAERLEDGGRAWFPLAEIGRLALRRQVEVEAAGEEPRRVRPRARPDGVREGGASPSAAARDAEPGVGAPGPDARLAPAAAFREEPLPLDALPRDAVAGLAIARYASPWYLDGDRRIPAGGSLGPPGGATRDASVAAVVVAPAGRPPPGGWPLALFGHGYGGEMLSSALLVAGTLARHGLATAAISVVGHGGGPESRLVVELRGGETRTVRVPGRGVDLDGDGRIARAEGLAPRPGGPFASLGLRDGLRQQVVDLMALVRALRGGLDLDGDGRADTGQGPLLYAGQSLGGIYGTLFLAVEPRVRAGVLNVPGGPVSEVARLSAAFRPLVRQALASREPPLLNLPGDFREDLPARPDEAVREPAPGAPAIQEYLARAAWLGRRGDPVAYAPHLWRALLPGMEPARVLVQYALHDRVVPNPTTRTLVRAGELGDRTVLLRTDRLARLLGDGAAPEPHGFLLAVRAPGLLGQVARAAQEQMARFLRDEGEAIWAARLPGLAPGAGPLFETPAEEPLHRGAPAVPPAPGDG